MGDPVCWYKIPTLKTDLFKGLRLIKTPSQEEKKATVNVYWGHWEGPLFTLDTASGYTHTHAHITYGSCVPITQHKAKTHKQTKTRTHALTLAEAKASILFVYVTLVLFYHYYGAKVGMVVIFLAHYIDQCSVNILNILEYPRIIANFHFFLSVVWFLVFSRWLSSSPGKFARQFIPFQLICCLLLLLLLCK